MKMPFIPNQGKDEIIQKQTIREGNIYFATDSGKIYLDTANERVTIGGGGVAIIYASAKNVAQDKGDLKYILYTSDLDNKEITPKKDDLIINSNGTFYKVYSFTKSSGLIKCTRIAVSGTGGGGGGGGGGGSTDTTKYTSVESVGTTPNAQTYIYGKSQYVKFKVESTHDALITLNYYVTNIATNNTETYSFSVMNGDTHPFDLGAVLQKGQNTLIVEAIGANSGMYQLEYPSINCIELALKESNNFNPLKYAYNSDMSFHFIPVGKVKKTLRVFIDDNLELTKDLLATDDEKSMSVTISKKAHGVYTLRADLAYSMGATTIYTDPLVYQIAFLDEGNEAPLVWYGTIPEKIINHDKLNLQYMVYDPASPDRTSVRRYMNGKEIASLDNIAYSDKNWLTWNVSNYQLGENEFIIQCGSTSAGISVYVEEDENRDLDVLTADLYLNLTSSGRSNSENETLRQEWYYERSDSTKSVVKFNNFNWYNNGWIQDDVTGDSVLRISNGASIEIPVSVMNTRDLDSNLTFEFQFKLRNVQKYESLIEISSEEIKNDKGETVEIKVTKTVKSTDGVWCNYYGNEIGMCLGTQEGFFKSKQVIASGRYKEDDIVTVSFVVEKATATNQYPLLYMYINGILSSIINYDKTSDTFAANVQNIIINSDYCDVDLYKVRVYKAALSSADIVHNYIADRSDAQLYDMNQIIEFKDNIPSISYTKMKDYNAAHASAPLLPYAVLECVDKTEDLLPFIKGGKRYVNVEFVNPSLDYAYDNGLITGEQYIMGCPSYTATNIQFDVQGTSSQGYPRRNYKAKFKKEETGDKANTWFYTNGPLKGKEVGVNNDYNGVTYKNYYMDNHYSESTFTWKADYMESSMTHNTGFASFVKTLYSKHPLQDYNSDIDVTDRRTTVYGFPMIVFQKKKDGTYEFIGRYNYNLDKGCNNVIGFKESTKHPILTDKKISEVAECWELLNNQGGRTSFTMTNFEAVNDKKELTMLDDFEVRYHNDSDAIEEAIKLEGDFENKSREEANAFILSKYANLEKMAKWLESTNSKAATNAPLAEPYEYSSVTYTTDSAEYRVAKFAKEFDQWFDREYCAIYFIMTELLIQYDSRGKNMMLATWGPKVANGNYIWYPVFYDIDTQLGVNNSGVPSWDYDTETSPFYGPGVFSTPNSVLWYNFEQCFMTTIQNTYIDLRKNNLTYEKLKGYYDYDAAVSGSYAMMGDRPINIINVDQYWKYIAPTFSGYINTSGETVTDNGTRFYCLQGTRQLQRDLFLRNRFNYLDSKWLAGTYSVEGMTQAFMVRINPNYYPATSDRYIDTVLTPEEESQGYIQAAWKQPLDTDVEFKITPYLHSYGTLFWDVSKMTGPLKWDGKNPLNLAISEEMQDPIKTQSAMQEQIFRLGGGEYISSLGDLSKFYINEMNLTPLKRLKYLYFGSDDPGYYNSLDIRTFALNASATNPNGTPNLNTKALLEEVVLTNVTQLTGAFDVTGAEKLREFRALGTTITGVTFANGGQMKVIHLPNTITHLTFTEPVSLRGLITSSSNFKDENNKFIDGLYVPGITTTGNLDNSTSIEKLQIIGGNMGYSSYQLMKNLVDIKTVMQTEGNFEDEQKTIAISLEKVLWSPYKLVEYGVALDKDKTYVLKNEHSGFDAYSPTTTNWDSNTLNELVYELIPENDAEKDCLTDLNIIKMFIHSNNIGEITKDEEGNDKRPIAGEDVPNYFRDVTQHADRRTTYPYLSGDIYINNLEGNEISEYEIKQIIDNYYPNLNIFAAHVTPAYTLKMVEVVKDEEAGTKQIIELQTVKYNPVGTVYANKDDIKVNPSRLHHYFMGWSLSENGPVLSNEEINALAFSKDAMIYTLYARFDWDSYTATYYNGDEPLGEKPTSIYGEYFKEPSEIPSRENDEQDLPIDERIAFYGWSDKKPANPIMTSIEEAAKVVVDVTAIKATENRNFYAIFVKENVYSKATDDKYFEYSESTVTVNGVEGYSIKANSKYNLKGKVTIPATYNNYPIVAIGDFRTAFGVTGFFFMENPFLYEVSERAFEFGANSSDIKLIGVYLPESITTIKPYAFSNTQKLQHISDKFVKEGIAGHIGSNITSIGNYAFKNAGALVLSELPPKLQVVSDYCFQTAGENVRLSSLPDSVTKIGMAAFMQCPNVQITNFGKKASEVGSSSGLSYIGTYAFANAGLTGAHSSINRIFIWDTVTNIESGAFNSYGTNVEAYTSFSKTNVPTGWTDVNPEAADGGGSAIGVAMISYDYTGEV